MTNRVPDGTCVLILSAITLLQMQIIINNIIYQSCVKLPVQTATGNPYDLAK